MNDTQHELNRLRNRHVARTLDAIGTPDERTIRAVKKGFSMIRNDFECLLNTGNAGAKNEQQKI
jgi:hypothetical protein